MYYDCFITDMTVFMMDAINSVILLQIINPEDLMKCEK